MTEPELFTVAEAARVVGVSVAAVNARIASGRLPCVARDDLTPLPRRVARADVEAWILERTTRAMAVVRNAAALG
jgi:hypothetical protein